MCPPGPIARHAELEALYQSLNPSQLRRDLETALERLWTFAVPDPQRTPGDITLITSSLTSTPASSSTRASVTLNYEVTRIGG